MQAVNIKMEHRSVMMSEVLEGLNVKPEGIYVDATFGCGGHSAAILEQLGSKGRLLVIDKDPDAIQRAKDLKDPRVMVCHGSFANLSEWCAKAGFSHQLDGVLLDLGVSSPQLDTPMRGFSFRLEGPLDMRMDPTQGVSAADWINAVPEAELAWVFKVFGEERFHKRIARAIVVAREISPIFSTLQLAKIITDAHPAWERHKHPATRCFQAIRIYINHELEELSLVLDQSLQELVVGGRLVVISFHSLEDRIVKQFIQKGEKGDMPLRKLPLMGEMDVSVLRRIGKKQKASMGEVQDNVRSRSAVLRIAEKMGESQ